LFWSREEIETIRFSTNHLHLPIVKILKNKKIRKERD